MAAWSQWKWMLGVRFKMETAAWSQCYYENGCLESVLLWKRQLGVNNTMTRMQY